MNSFHSIGHNWSENRRLVRLISKVHCALQLQGVVTYQYLESDSRQGARLALASLCPPSASGAHAWKGITTHSQRRYKFLT
jgi:hypothetical protein